MTAPVASDPTKDAAMARNYYDVLGVARNADEKAIRSAFRRLARKHHPDLNPNDAAAERKFKEINEAHEVLSDADKRAKYDRHGDNWMHADRIDEAQAARRHSGRTSGGAHGGVRYDFSTDDLSDLFSNLGDLSDLKSRIRHETERARYKHGSHIDVPLSITLEEAYNGGKRQVTLPHSVGSKRIEVAVPRAVDDGSRVHISLDDGTQVFFVISLMPHPRFTRDGDDLYHDLIVPFEDAVLGGEVQFESLKGRLALKVPRGSADGRRIRISGHGMPNRSYPGAFGDLYVVVKPQIPTDLDTEEEELLRRFRQVRINNGKRK